MFFFFPYTTDAPIYHWPFATLGLIAANVLIFGGMLTGAIANSEDWMLWYGHGLHPAQWLTSNFTHGGVDHLVSNMLFLWVFGLVIEGKLGWWRFLACYLGIGVVQAMLEQLVMLGYGGEVPGSIGASAAIFGLLAMAAVWAPKNEITFFWIFFVRTGTFDVSILVMAMFYTGLELLFALLGGSAAGSSLLHLSGMALGFPLGIVLLKRGLVDCEGWDLFHVLGGDYGAFKKEPDPRKTLEEMAAIQHRRNEALLAEAKSRMRKYLADGNTNAAFILHNKMKSVGPGLRLDRNELLILIKGLHASQRWSDSAPFMADLIARFPNGTDAVRVKLAQICVVALQRPGKALDLLAEIDSPRLPAALAGLVPKIEAKARQMQDEGIVELDVETW